MEMNITLERRTLRTTMKSTFWQILVIFGTSGNDSLWVGAQNTCWSKDLFAKTEAHSFNSTFFSIFGKSFHF